MLWLKTNCNPFEINIPNMNRGNAEAVTQNKKFNAVHVGISGFPFGSAAINKCLAVYESLIPYNVDFLIINNRAVHGKNIPVPLKKAGTINRMKYVYTSYSPYRSDSFLTRNFSQVWGRIREFCLLVDLGRTRSIDFMFYYPTNGSFFELLMYRAVSKTFGIRLIAHYVEFRTAFVEDINAFDQLKHRLYDKYFMRFVDAVLPISEFLIRQLESRHYHGRYLKVPPLTDFNQFKIDAPPAQEKFFLYVGSAAYLNAIEFITRAFDETLDSDFYLYLVVNGSTEHMIAVEKTIRGLRKRDYVKTFSKLKYSTLIEMYRQAKALLIPLTSNITDVARFPQKISEYLASENPVITTRNGEIPYYFTDMQNALVAEEYAPQAFALKMDLVVTSPTVAAEIGRRGYETGRKFFDLHSYGEELRQLLVELDSGQIK